MKGDEKIFDTQLNYKYNFIKNKTLTDIIN